MSKETIINTSRKEVVEVVKILIEMLDEMSYENPNLNVEVSVDDGRKFRLKFERTDLDFKNDKRSVSEADEKSCKHSFIEEHGLMVCRYCRRMK